MPNLDLRGKNFYPPKELQKFVGGQNSISYENMKKLKSELTKLKTSNEKSFINKGGDEMLKWLTKDLKDGASAIHNVKKTRMDAGEENMFKKTHTKDRDNANPTAVGLPKLHKGSMNRQIMSNQAVYETYDEELSNIKYLIEYMCTNNKKLKL